MNPDDMDFGDEPAFIIERITVFPNSKMEVILADGDRAHFELCRYSPILGWRCKEPARTSSVSDRAGADPSRIVERQCIYCGRTFSFIRGFGHDKQKFCNTRCRNHWWYHHLEARGTITEMPVFTCQHCGKRFTDFAGKKRKYCSQECYIQERFHSQDN